MLATLDIIALLVTILWPIIPLWWIPVHGAKKTVRRIGFFIYPIVGMLWIFIAYAIYVNRTFLLECRIDVFIPMKIGGILCACVGIFLQLWTLKVLSLGTITGVPEIFSGTKTTLTIHGPFLHVRHPTYISHTLFFLGIFLATGILITGLIVLIDFLIISLIIIPLEERELLRRFGDEYRSYMASVPRYIPRLIK
jgi:protein-S-isoprenylcysteine O-methyltransferase Ste14